MKVGTDCSGIEAPIQALKILGIDFKHVFSSDIDKFARESIGANYKPEVLFEDMTQERNLPKLDLYVCGFPCQSFSLLGDKKGLDDSRGNIFISVIQTIKKTEPTIFILENVRNIMHIKKGECFKVIKNELDKLIDYNVYYQVLNTADYGIPQIRRRLYMVGIKKSKMIAEFKFPQPIHCCSIKNYIDHSNKESKNYCNSYNSKKHLWDGTTFFNMDSVMLNTKNYKTKEFCNTITTSSLWNIFYNRPATIKEYLMLQGFPVDFKQVVSDRQMKKQIGNSMSVNVLVELFKSCFECI